jgi:hypothetical protein
MHSCRKLPLREQVFIRSLTYHGFRVAKRETHLKKRKRYIIPSTKAEDASLVDFWVKLAGDTKLIPVQITQRGIGIFRLRSKPSATQLEEFSRISEERLRRRRKACATSRIAFVLVRDYTGARPSRSLAWGDKKALEFGLASITT